jgi:mannose-6-phosphate isomerase-like protein (cupin superfamily)
VATALGLTLSEFLAFSEEAPAESPPTARISWARRGSGQTVELDTFRYDYLCTDLRAKRLVPLIGRVRARSLEEFGPLRRHEGEEFLFVLEGRVEIHTEFYAAEVLEAGEGVYLDSRMGHAAINAGRGEAVLLSVTTDPSRMEMQRRLGAPSPAKAVSPKPASPARRSRR